MGESKYYKWRKDGNKMIIDSGYKEFDKQTNYISAGNVIANTQYSNCIRPYNETEIYGGKHKEKGDLQDFDLQYFNLPYDTKQFIKELTLYEKATLYQFHIYRKNGRRDIIGWLLIGKEQVITKIFPTYTPIRFEKCKKALDLAENIILENMGVK